MGPELLIPITALCIPILAIWTTHQRKVLEMQMALRASSAAVPNTAVEALSDQMRHLRETTTQYDISFDTALQRLEARVAELEQAQSRAPWAAELRQTR